MLLRLILVGLVTSLSLELPSGRDVSSWAESGRAWANAQLEVAQASEVTVIEPAAPAAESPTPTAEQADREFQDVVGAMAAGFAAEVADRADEVQVAAAPGATSAVADEVDSVALPDGEELAAVAPAEDAVVAAVDPDAMVAEEAEGDDASSRADRLADAVRLTREAAEAWAAVIGAPAAEVDCGR